MSKKCNGWNSRAAWNVSLWINNDEGLYNMARDLARRMTRREAAAAMLETLHESGVTQTPDGYRYTVTSIRGAMSGII